MAGRWRLRIRLKEAANLALLLEAGDGTRTHDPQLGKLMLYQLSYTRVADILAPQDFRLAGVSRCTDTPEARDERSVGNVEEDRWQPRTVRLSGEGGARRSRLSRRRPFSTPESA